MKTYNVTNRVSRPARQALERIVQTHERFEYAYFLKPATSARQRRYNERIFADSNPELAFITKDGLMTVKATLSETCYNVYYKLTITVDDKVKNIKAVKNLLN